MKSYIVIFLGFLLLAPVLSCNKHDTTYPNAGIIYNSTGINDEIHKTAPGSQKTDTQQITDKLKSMNNDDLFQFALTCGNQGNYSEAMTAFHTLLEKEKNYPGLYYYQGLLYRNMGLLDEAICAFQTAINQNPNSAEAYYNLAMPIDARDYTVRPFLSTESLWSFSLKIKPSKRPLFITTWDFPTSLMG